MHTSSTSGLLANPGQANYGAAKSGIATFSQICAKELVRYGVKSNCIAPAARTRLTLATPGLGDMIKAPAEAGAFDVWDPANISPLVAYLATADCAFNGETFFVQGGTVRIVKSWEFGDGVEQNERWSVGAPGRSPRPPGPTGRVSRPEVPRRSAEVSKCGTGATHLPQEVISRAGGDDQGTVAQVEVSSPETALGST